VKANTKLTLIRKRQALPRLFSRSERWSRS